MTVYDQYLHTLMLVNQLLVFEEFIYFLHFAFKSSSIVDPLVRSIHTNHFYCVKEEVLKLHTPCLPIIFRVAVRFITVKFIIAVITF